MVCAAVCASCITRQPIENDRVGDTSDDRPIVILLIGDGMGRAQMAAGSYFATGTADGLFLHSIESRGDMLTQSPTGTTDSAASATAMATGTFTFNGVVGLNRAGERRENLIEIAHAHGLSAGLVTTTEITHATPASFGAHVSSRGHAAEIARQYAEDTLPEVLLGGGARHFRGVTDGQPDLIQVLKNAQYSVASTASELRSQAANSRKLVGLFHDRHMTYELDRDEATEEPHLRDMAMAAIEVLDRDPDGWIVMIEGGRIDHAGHANDIARLVPEMIEFDQTVRAVAEWARTRPNATVIVTADHETGGLQIVRGNEAGTLPDVTFRTGGHTTARVDVLALGQRAEKIHGRVVDHRWLHSIASARITGQEFTPPGDVPISNGFLSDLRHLTALQPHTSSFGAGHSQLDALRLDGDRYGLAVGVEGLFETGTHTVAILIDVDFGTATGVSDFRAATSDDSDALGGIVARLPIRVTANGFGADFVLASQGATSVDANANNGAAGLRGLHPPLGLPTSLGWHPVSVSFGEPALTFGIPVVPRALEGMEAFIPWQALYPDLNGGVPAGATIAVVAVLVGGDGKLVSNQLLPPIQSDRTSSDTLTVIRNIAVFEVDANRDWVGDGDVVPRVEGP